MDTTGALKEKLMKNAWKITNLLLCLFIAPAAWAQFDEDELAMSQARDVLELYMETFNSGDWNAWADTLHYPHIRIAGGAVRVSQNKQEYLQTVEGGLDRLKAAGWARSAWMHTNVVHVSPSKIHFDTRFARYDEGGNVLAVYNALYIVTRQDGRWGVQARSSFAP
jgi:hypothetical protein